MCLNLDVHRIQTQDLALKLNLEVTKKICQQNFESVDFFTDYVPARQAIPHLATVDITAHFDHHMSLPAPTGVYSFCERGD